jgi:hypothetical protein
VELLDFPIVLSSYKEKVYVHLFTDIHRASSGCDVRRLKSDINRLKKSHEKAGESHWWIGGGDWANAIGPKDRRHDSAAIAPSFRRHIGSNLFGEEARALVADFRHIRDNCIGVGMGNHEDSIARHGEFNPATYIAEQLDVPFLGYSALVRMRLTYKAHTENIVIYWHHGRGAARTKGSKVKMLWGLRDQVEADVYLTGHVHELIDFPDVKLHVPRTGEMRLLRSDRLFVNGGTYQKALIAESKPQSPGAYDDTRDVRPDYAEKAGLRPSVIGHNGFRVQLSKTRVGIRNNMQWHCNLKRVDFAR